MWYKKVVQILFMFVVIFSLMACSSQPTTTSNEVQQSSSSEKEPIKIGVIVSATGVIAELGKDQRKVYEMMEEKINSEGGINGHPLDLLIYDDESDGSKALALTKKAINEGAIAILGGTGSSSAIPMADYLDAEQIPYISVASSGKVQNPQGPDGPVRKWVFKTAAGEAEFVNLMVDYVKKQGWKKIAWASDSGGFGQSGVESFEKFAAEAGLEIVSKEFFESSVNTIIPQLSSAKQMNPDVLMIFTAGRTQVIAQKDFKQLQWDIPVLHPMTVELQAFLDAAGDAANGIIYPATRYAIVDYLPNDAPDKQFILDFKKQFNDKYGHDANTFGVLAYDAVNVVKEVLEKVGEPSKFGSVEEHREAIRNQIESYEGLSAAYGDLKYSPNNHLGLDDYSHIMSEINDKKITPLK